jgi:hypothetical protein
MDDFPSTPDPKRLPFSIPYRYEVLQGDTEITVEIWRRDPLLTYNELIHYIQHLPFNHRELGHVPCVAHIPARYRITDSQENRLVYRQPFSPYTFYNYCVPFHLLDGTLIHTKSNLPVCTTDIFDTFRIYAGDISNAFLDGRDRTPTTFRSMVQQRSRLFFVDGDVFADYFVNGSTLPYPSDLGLFGGDSWLRQRRTADLPRPPVQDFPVSLHST